MGRVIPSMILCAPLVSIVLPNLNYFPFLYERVGSISSQTHSNWECIVIDGYSTDGSWEFFTKTATLDPRFRIYQELPRGIYDAWNKGIKRAKGEFVYIATSDDTMRPDFLEKMLAALEACPSAGIAHCCLTLIDVNGKPLPKNEQWRQWRKVRFYGDWIQKYHIRKVPYDAIMHSVYTTVYTSITQLLIRKKLINKIGWFENHYGAIGDFEWGLRASLSTDTIHVPLFLTSWRYHKDQATDSAFRKSSNYFDQLVKMTGAAIKKSNRKWIRENDFKGYYFSRYLSRLSKENSSAMVKRRATLLSKGIKLSPSLMLNYILQKLKLIEKIPKEDSSYAEYLLAMYPKATIVPIEMPK